MPDHTVRENIESQWRLRMTRQGSVMIGGHGYDGLADKLRSEQRHVIEGRLR